jgi:hypothetical protein
MAMTVFLSYAHHDAPTATSLARDLEELEGSVWLDKSLTGGQRWWDEILRQIRECRLFVLAVSRQSLSSGACLAESSYAVSIGRPFLAVRIAKVDLVGAPESIRDTQLIDYVADDPASIKGLARAVLHAPPPGPLPQEMPAPPPVPESYRDRFAALFGRDMSMADQVNAFARLKLDVDNDQNADDARELLRVLHDRPDVAWRVREDIATYLSRPTAPPPPPDAGRSPAAPAPGQEPLPVPGWYADPTRRFELRYWDGGRWTGHVGRGGRVFSDPLPAT